MIETDEQRRWWFATHPEYSWNHRGTRAKHSEKGAEQRDYSPEDVDKYVAEGLKYYPTGPIAAMLQALKWGLGTNEGPTPLDALLKSADSEGPESDLADESPKDQDLHQQQDDNTASITNLPLTREKGYQDAKQWLLDPSSRPKDFSFLLDPSFREANPDYLLGIQDAHAEIKQDPRYRQGFRDGYNMPALPPWLDQEHPYYREGVADGMTAKEQDRYDIKDAFRSLIGMSDSQTLGKNLRKAGEGPPEGSEGWEPHHICPSGSMRNGLPEARAKLDRNGIKINSAENGLYVPREFNQKLNNGFYENMLSTGIRQAETREQALEFLARMKAAIREAPEQFYRRVRK